MHEDLYLGELVGKSLEVRSTPERGRGLYATKRPVGQPALIFTESSLGKIIQVSPCYKRGLACSLCGHVLGSPVWQLQKLTGLQRRADSDILNESLSEILEGQPLFSRVPPLFCSIACLREHERILGRLRSQRKAARLFARYSRKVGCVFHMLALKLLCWCIAEVEKSPERAAAPLRALCSRLYWEAVDMPSEPAEQAAFKAKLQKETEISRQLALRALGPGLELLPIDLKQFLEPVGYAKLLGSLCSNCTSVKYISPVLQYILQIDSMKDGACKTAAIRELEPWIRSLAKNPLDMDGSDVGEAAGEDEQKLISWSAAKPLHFSTALIPPFRGYAIFPRMALMNHSCKPSCGIEFDFAGRIFVLQQPYVDIKPGVELTISYLDSSLESEERLQAAGMAAAIPNGVRWIPGFENRRVYAGPAFRRSPAIVEEGRGLVDPEMPPLEERVYLVTGATKGHGLETAMRLLDSGCSVILHGKSEDLLKRYLSDLSDSFETHKIDGFECDLQEMEDVESLASLIAERHPRIHGILHNAATIDGSFTGKRKYTFNFHAEQTMAVNALAPFYLTSLLLPQLEAAGNARVMFATSPTMGGSDHLDDLKCERYWTGLHSYRLSKLCLEMVAKEMHLRYGAAPNLTFHSFNPGTADTKLMRQGTVYGAGKKMGRGRKIVKTEQPNYLPAPRVRKAAYFAMVDDKYQRESGHFVGDAEKMPQVIQDAAAREKLWQEFVELTGAQWPEARARVRTEEEGVLLA
ncbi:DHRSX [Symbiodinium sp. KB8]|nr:DHRSX [Symbiodinium sp. KB8]